MGTCVKWNTVKIVFGINSIVLLFIGLTIVTDLYSEGLSGFQFEISQKSVKPTYELFTNKNIHNETYYKRNELPKRKQVMVTNIAFLKVHKAGSTTMQNLFFRFGMRHNLNIVLPITKYYIYSMENVVPLEPPKTYNIFAMHSRYNKSFFESVVPGDSVKIAIVREPVERLISAAYYYRDVWHNGYLRKIPRDNFIYNLINYPEKYDRWYFSRTHNAMGDDFGFEKSLKHNDTEKINAYLELLNSEFQLVLLVEKFDESLIMMKRYLNWSLRDVIYLKANSNKHTSYVLNSYEKDKVRQTNFLDFAIYEYFTKEFEAKLESMSEDFYAEVEYFKAILNTISKFCSQTHFESDSELPIDKSHWNEEFMVLAEECKWMKSSQTDFVAYFSVKQSM